MLKKTVLCLLIFCTFISGCSNNSNVSINNGKSIMFSCDSLDVKISQGNEFSWNYDGEEERKPEAKWVDNTFYILQQDKEGVVVGKRTISIVLSKEETYVDLAGNSKSGDLIIENNMFKTINYNNMSGNISVLGGQLNDSNFNSMSGNINIVGTDARTIIAKTMSGNVNINISDNSGDITASSQSGTAIVNGVRQ